MPSGVREVQPGRNQSILSMELSRGFGAAIGMAMASILLIGMGMAIRVSTHKIFFPCAYLIVNFMLKRDTKTLWLPKIVIHFTAPTPTVKPTNDPIKAWNGFDVIDWTGDGHKSKYTKSFIPHAYLFVNLMLRRETQILSLPTSQHPLRILMKAGTATAIMISAWPRRNATTRPKMMDSCTSIPDITRPRDVSLRMGNPFGVTMVVNRRWKQVVRVLRKGVSA